MPDMAADQGHGQLADLVDEGLDPSVFEHPCLDLLEQVLGHIHGACLACLSEGEVVSLVQGAAMVAGAGGLATALGYAVEAGRQEGAGRDQLLESALEHPADQGRAAGDTHGWALGTSGKRMLYRERPEKPGVRRKKRTPGEAERLKGHPTPELRRCQGATNSSFLRAVGLHGAGPARYTRPTKQASVPSTGV